jgi:hypothetical protein
MIIFFLIGQSLDVFDPFDELDLASHQMQSALQCVSNNKDLFLL